MIQKSPIDPVKKRERVEKTNNFTTGTGVRHLTSHIQLQDWGVTKDTEEDEKGKKL